MCCGLNTRVRQCFLMGIGPKIDFVTIFIFQLIEEWSLSVTRKKYAVTIGSLPSRLSKVVRLKVYKFHQQT